MDHLPRKKILIASSALLLAAGLSSACAAADTAGGLQASNLMNPNISVIGWFQGEAGRRYVDPGVSLPPALDLKEAEIGFQSIVDPYATVLFA